MGKSLYFPLNFACETKTALKHSLFKKKNSPQIFSCLFFFFFFFFFFVFLGLHLLHVEVPRLGIKSELHLLACTTATATRDPSCFCDLHHSPRQCRIFNLLREARNQTQVLMHASRFH